MALGEQPNFLVPQSSEKSGGPFGESNSAKALKIDSTDTRATKKPPYRNTLAYTQEPGTKFPGDTGCDKTLQILIPQEVGKQIMEHPEDGIAWQLSERMKQKQRDDLSSSFLLQQFPVPSALPGHLPVAPRSCRLTPAAPTPSRAPGNQGMFHKELAIRG